MIMNRKLVPYINASIKQNFFSSCFVEKACQGESASDICLKSHNVSPHTASDFLFQGLGQLQGRCAQETSDLFVTKATTTSHWPLHLKAGDAHLIL